MKIHRPSPKKTCDSSTSSNLSVGLGGLLAIFSTGFVAATETSWRQFPLDPPTEAAGHAWTGDVIPASDELIAALGDQTQCRIGNAAGVKGLITLTDAGLNGTFLALWWDESGALTATVRSTASLPVESFTLREGKQTELILVRRGRTIYAYAVASGVEDPLIAVDFASGFSVVAGALVDKDSSEQAPAMSSVVAAPTLTGDVLQKQPATALAGNWTSEDDPGSLGGSHLLNRGDSAEASASIRIENLLPGTHELWIRYAAAPSRTTGADVTVEGFGKPVSLVVNQQISGGLWLPLGRFETKSATSTTIRLAPGQPGSGYISIDAVHVVWAAWDDKNHDELPDALEGTTVRDTQLNEVASKTKGVDSPARENFTNSDSPSLSMMTRSAVSDGSRSVFFVHSALGNDAFDGRVGHPHPGAWFSVRGGPKKTIAAALKSAPKTAKVIELHLDGELEPPPGGFQNLGDINLILVPGQKGSSLGTSQLPPYWRPPSPPSRALRP